MLILSRRPTVAELCASDTARAHGIDNTPPAEVVQHLLALSAALECVVIILGHPLTHSSGYRCPLLNDAVHGVHDSDHLYGWAEDFTCAAFGSPLQIVKAIEASDLPFHQLIQEGTWAHLSVKPDFHREVMTAHFDEHGKATYTKGA